MACVNCHQDGNCTFDDEVWFSTAGRKRVAQVVLGNLSNGIRIYQSLVSETNLEVKKKGGTRNTNLGRRVGVFMVQFSRRGGVFFFPSLLSLYGIIIKNLSFILKVYEDAWERYTLSPPHHPPSLTPSIFEGIPKVCTRAFIIIVITKWIEQLN